jgi:hypothetical protein
MVKQNKKMRQTLTILIILSLLALAGCSNSATDKSKELELKEKSPTEANSNKAETTEKTESVKTVDTPPEKNSSEREQIMDVLRVPVEKELKQEIIFKVGSLKVLGDWAFLQGEPINKASGKRADLTGTKYGEDNWEDFDNNIFALLKKKAESWTIVERAMMCSDVCYDGWDKKHGAPKEIFDPR